MVSSGDPSPCRDPGPLSLALLFASSALATAGCGPHELTAEVLPPRTSTTCAAPTASSSVLARGLLDVDATNDFHGAYVADLRISAFGQNAKVDGISISYALPSGASSASSEAATKAAGDQTNGDIVLVGDDDDVRRAVLEGVELVPRDLAVALRDDDGLALTADEFATLQIDIKPISDGFDTSTTSFALNLCKGCLVDPPSTAGCANGPVRNSVCRVGQDVPVFSCSATPTTPATAP